MSLLNPPLERMFFMTFTVDLKQFTNKDKPKSLLLLREVAIELFSEIIKKRPIGDPSLWKGNLLRLCTWSIYKAIGNATLGSPASGMLSFEDKSRWGNDFSNEICHGRNGTVWQAIYLTNNLCLMHKE